MKVILFSKLSHTWVFTAVIPVLQLQPVWSVDDSVLTLELPVPKRLRKSFFFNYLLLVARMLLCSCTLGEVIL